MRCRLLPQMIVVSVSQSVCLSCCKNTHTDRGGPKHIVLDRGPDPPHGEGEGKLDPLNISEMAKGRLKILYTYRGLGALTKNMEK